MFCGRSQRIEVDRVLTLAILAGTTLLVAFAAKESCPFVYVDRGQGLELVGEAYTGAGLKAVERNDLLPLATTPWLDSVVSRFFAAMGAA